MVKLIGTGGNQAPTNNMLGNMAFQNKEGAAIDLLGLAAGTAAAPSLIPTGDPNTGVWFPAADTVAVSTGGTERLRVNSSGDIGVGTSSPASGYRMDIQASSGRMRLTSTTGTNTTDFQFINTGGTLYSGIDSSAGGISGAAYSGLMWHSGAYPLVFGTNNVARMRIDSSGRVGIGTTSPSAKLDISTNFSSDNIGTNIYLPGVSGGASGSVYGLKVSTGSSNNASALYGVYSDINYTNSQTNYGGYFSAREIYTTSYGIFALGTQPDLNGGGISYGGYFRAASVNAGAAGSTYAARVENTATSGAAAYGLVVSTVAGANSIIPFQALHAGSEIMRLTSTGRLGIGTTSPNSLLEVRGTSTSFDGYIQVTAPAGGGGARTPAILLKDEYYAYQGGLTGNHIASVYAGLNLELASSSTDVYTSRSKITIGIGANPGFVVSNSSNKGVSYTDAMILNGNNNLGLGTSTFGSSAIKVMAIGSGTAPTTGPADTIQIYSSDLSAGNTMLSIFTEGTTVNANATAAATHRIAIRVNGTVYYLLANTSA
jgi:hypothetical protein